MFGIIKEFNRRWILNKQIDSVIEELFEYSSSNKSRLRHEATIRLILKIIRVPRNYQTCIMINNRMRAHKFNPIILRGYGFYKNITIRHSSLSALVLQKTE